MDNNTQAALDAGKALGDNKSIGSHPYIVVPQGATVQDAESYLPAPLRKKGSVILNVVGSFIAYVNAEKSGATRIYGQQNPPGFVAVLDDHGAEPAWKDYRASYACPRSLE